MCDPTPDPPKHRHDAACRGRSSADRALAERLLSDAKAGRDVRRGKVRRVRAAIEARSYENDLKLEVALERLQDRVREDAAGGGA
jgi:hypothetical protein